MNKDTEEQFPNNVPIVNITPDLSQEEKENIESRLFDIFAKYEG